jgi:hypothetical protein
VNIFASAVNHLLTMTYGKPSMVDGTKWLTPEGYREA